MTTLASVERPDPLAARPVGEDQARREIVKRLTGTARHCFPEVGGRQCTTKPANL